MHNVETRVLKLPKTGQKFESLGDLFPYLLCSDHDDFVASKKVPDAEEKCKHSVFCVRAILRSQGNPTQMF